MTEIDGGCSNDERYDDVLDRARDCIAWMNVARRQLENGDLVRQLRISRWMDVNVRTVLIRGKVVNNCENKIIKVGCKDAGATNL